MNSQNLSNCPCSKEDTVAELAQMPNILSEIHLRDELVDDSLPFSLQASIPQGSYPTHLEISASQLDTIEFTKITSMRTENPGYNSPVYERRESITNVIPSSTSTGQIHLCSKTDDNGLDNPGNVKIDNVSQVKTFVRTNQLAYSNNIESTETISAQTQPESKCLKPQREEDRPMAEEEEVIFFAFVILHAEEDMDMAESFREKLESVGVGKGATFSEDFAIPGKNTLMCVEDAIDNSAFTILLLTQNFNTRLLEVETNSALINSINNKHKYNSVIPLLPEKNSMPRDSLPIVLQTLVPLEENKSFDRKAKKALTPASIERQRKVWVMEQRVKETQRRQERLQLAKLSLKLIRENKEIVEQNMQAFNGEFQPFLQNLHPERSSGTHVAFPRRANVPLQPNISIQNARYIMIGNDSQMTLGLSGEGIGNNDKLPPKEHE